MVAALRVIHEDEFYRVERLPNRVVRVVRSTKPFSNADEVEKAHRPLQAALDGVGRSRSFLLIDSRAVVGKNDPASEKNMATHRQAMARGFLRVAILVQTSIGLLQSRRLLAEDGTSNATPFTSESLALAHLKEASPKSGSRPR